MQNSVNKGFFSYLLIFIVIVVAIILTMGAIMLMSPEVKILGYEYVSSKNKIMITHYNGADKALNDSSSIVLVDGDGEEISKLNEGATSINFETLNKIVIKTNGMKVNVIYSGEEDRVDIVRNVSGFTKEGSVVKLVATKHYEDGVFTISAFDTTPMLSLGNSSKIDVYLNKNTTSNLNVEVETVSANLSIATTVYDVSKEPELVLKSVKYTTKTGNLTSSKYATITNQIHIESETDSNISLNKDLTLAQDLIVNLKAGRLKFNNITAQSAMISGDNVNITAQNLLLGEGNGLTLHVIKGDIVMDKVGGFVNDVDDKAENVLIKIKEVSGYFTMSKIDIAKANKANIELGTVGGEIFIKANTSNVKVVNAKDDATIETLTGSIEIRNNKTDSKTSTLNIKSKSGNIFVNMDHISGANQITAESGRVVLNHLNILENFEISVKSKGKIVFQPSNLEFNNQTVVGYPTPFEEEPETAFTESVNIDAGGRVEIVAVDALAWFK